VNIPEILQALEAQQLIQQRNPPSSELWKEASENIYRLTKLLPPPVEGLYCAYCRRSVDLETDKLEAAGDGLWLHCHCAEDLRADGQLEARQ